MSKRPLFRKEAEAARQNRHLGTVNVKQRPLYAFLSVGVIGAVVALLIMSVSLSWTRKEVLQGHLRFDKGVIKIYASQTGVLQTSHVRIGDHVNSGEPLFTVFTDRKMAAKDNFQESVSKLVMQRERLLLDEQRQLYVVERSEAHAIDEKLAMLNSASQQVQKQLEGQVRRVEILHNNVLKFEALLKEGFVSSEAVALKTADKIDSQDRVVSIQRELASIAMQARELELQKAALPKKSHAQSIQLERAVVNMRQELAESLNKASFRVAAPQTGTVTQILADDGDTVDQSTVMADIVPDGAKLQLRLIASDKQVGLIAPRARVSVQIEAFPYQKFGVIHGVISTIPVTPSSPKEIGSVATDTISSSRSLQTTFPLLIELDTQVISVNGTLVPLRAGMAAKATVDLETRKIYEWLFEPLFTLKY